MTSRPEPLRAPDALAQPAARRIVVAGEFNAGKSSVINLLLREAVLPAGPRFSDWPIAVVGAGTAGDPVLDAGDGRLAPLGSRPLTAASDVTVRIERPVDWLAGVEIVEVPIDTEGRIPEAGRAAMAAADVFLWCTMGQRAWTLSEIEIVRSLPDDMRDRAILVVTRSDYLRTADARALVLDRVSRQAGAHFSDVIAVNAGAEAVTASATDGGWTAANGRALKRLISAKLAALAPRAEGNVVPLHRPAAPRSAPERTYDPVLDWTRRQRGVARQVAMQDALEPAHVIEAVRAALTGARAAAEAGPAPAEGAARLLTLFDRSLAALAAQALDRTPETAAFKGLDLMRQLERELAIFAGAASVRSDADQGGEGGFHHHPSVIRHQAD